MYANVDYIDTEHCEFCNDWIGDYQNYLEVIVELWEEDHGSGSSFEVCFCSQKCYAEWREFNSNDLEGHTFDRIR